MAYKVTLLPGDGIGPEITEATLRVLDATGIKFDWEVMEAGEIAVKSTVRCSLTTFSNQSERIQSL